MDPRVKFFEIFLRKRVFCHHKGGWVIEIGGASLY